MLFQRGENGTDFFQAQIAYSAQHCCLLLAVEVAAGSYGLPSTQEPQVELWGPKLRPAIGIQSQLHACYLFENMSEAGVLLSCLQTTPRVGIFFSMANLLFVFFFFWTIMHSQVSTYSQYLHIYFLWHFGAADLSGNNLCSAA